jgi:dihydrolipoamide dehydrogenase
MGIEISGLKMNWQTTQQKKDKIVTGLTSGIEFLFKKNKTDYIKGFAKLVGNGNM